MKKTVCACGCAFFLMIAIQTNGQALLSPATRVMKIEREEIRSHPLLRGGKEEEKIGVFVEINDAEVLQTLRKLGFEPVQQLPKLLSLHCKISDLDVLATVPGILRIQMGQKVRQHLDRTVPEIGAKAAYEGLGTPKTYYTGEGVILGVIDWGLDLTHPAFKGEDGNSRIDRVWIQDSSGTPPSGFSYGAEYKGNAIFSQRYTSTNYHGTHVTGIAAGRGVGASLQYQGVAPKARIVFVELGDDETKLTDAVKYIFAYADSVNMPAVINLSLGLQYGPHDGTSYVDRIIDSLSGPGKIIVGSVGNSGYTSMHLSHVFTNPEKMNTVVLVYGSDNPDGMAYVDLWTKKNANPFTWKAYIYGRDGILYNESALHSSEEAVTSEWVSIGGDYRIKLTSASEKNLANDRTNFFLSVKNPRYNNYTIALEIEASNDTIHMWNIAQDGSGMGFAGFSKVKDRVWTLGDNDCTISEVGGTAHRIISVGALRPYPKVYDQGYYYREYYSSKGPTRDGRNKPDIMAPGTCIVAPLNSFSGITDPYFSVSENGRVYPYDALGGSSMSAPHVSGTTALYLQKDRSLSPEAVKEALISGALKLESMGNLPNNSYGNGILRVAGFLLGDMPSTSKPEFVLFPNPSQGNFAIKTIEGHAYSVQVYSMNGALVYKMNAIGTSYHQIPCISGIYTLVIRWGDKSEAHMLTIGRPR